MGRRIFNFELSDTKKMGLLPGGRLIGSVRGGRDVTVFSTGDLMVGFDVVSTTVLLILLLGLMLLFGWYV